MVWRQIQKLGAVTLYKTSEEFSKFIKFLLLLSYIPEKDIKREFLKFNHFCGKGQLYKDIIMFFEENFINNSSENPTKEIIFWSKYDIIKCGGPSTTKSVEAWHRGIYCSAVVRHPNIGVFNELLKKEESKAKLIVANLFGGKIKNERTNARVEIINVINKYKQYVYFEYF
jgi:hypothetical protein